MYKILLVLSIQLFAFALEAQKNASQYAGSPEKVVDAGPMVYTEGVGGGNSGKGPSLIDAEADAQRLFNAEELTKAYSRFAELRSFYAEHNNSVELWKASTELLFSDRNEGRSENCLPLEKILPKDGFNPKENYFKKLSAAMGETLYTELIFCAGYLGLNFTDAELWRGYAENRASVFNDVNALPNCSNRLKGFILATDLLYTLCLRKEEATNLTLIALPAIVSNE
jgi:hypothetical protein